ALDHPEAVAGVVMLAPALDPAQERAVWLGRLGTWVPFRWLLSGAMRTSAYEKATHVEELTKLMPRWEAWETPLAYVHGDKDMIVPYGNLAFARAHLTPTDTSTARFVTLPDENHFLHMEPIPEVISEIRRLLGTEANP
ncbi:MAG: prolyl oligopeptidase family serine peptidase, partial [Catalinimonas sp.]